MKNKEWKWQKLYKKEQNYLVNKKVMVQVFEGENKYVKNNYRLGKFTLLNLANKKKGK